MPGTTSDGARPVQQSTVAATVTGVLARTARPNVRAIGLTVKAASEMIMRRHAKKTSTNGGGDDDESATRRCPRESPNTTSRIELKATFRIAPMSSTWPRRRALWAPMRTGAIIRISEEGCECRDCICGERRGRRR